MSSGGPGDKSKTVDELADALLEEATRIVESKVDPGIDLNTAIYLAECAYFMNKKIRETGQLPQRWKRDSHAVAPSLNAFARAMVTEQRLVARSRARGEYARAALPGILSSYRQSFGAMPPSGQRAAEAVARAAFDVAYAMMAEATKRSAAELAASDVAEAEATERAQGDER